MLDVRGYQPELYRHFAAADLVTSQGGGTTTLELTVLKRPFISFPEVTTMICDAHRRSSDILTLDEHVEGTVHEGPFSSSQPEI
jgi:hypothetical protein